MKNAKNTVANYQDELNQPMLDKANIAMRISAFMIDNIIICIVLVAPFILFMLKCIENDPYRIFTMLPILTLIAFHVYSLRDIVKGRSPEK